MRKGFTLFFALLLIPFLTDQGFSQNPNLATSATVTHSGGGSGTRAPSNYNDGIISADPTGCPGTAPDPWGWTSTGSGQNGTGDWIEFEWSAPQTFGKFSFYHAYTCRRQLGGGDIQAWINNSWTTVHSFSFQSPWTIPVRETEFTPVTTSRVRITNMLIVGNSGQQISNPAFREIEIRNTITGPNDAGIVSLDSPRDFCAGQHDINVTLHNFGTNQLTSATINWTLNGVPQTAYSWSGLLDTINGPARQTQITLGTQNFLSGVPYTISVWTSMPNGVADTINMNDSTSVTVQAAMSGSYTIGGASPDYATITGAVADLNAFGVCGPVVFDIRPGTYNEQLELKDISGTSAVNTVVFQSETRSTADVNIAYTASGSGDNWVVLLEGARFVTFRDLTMTAGGSSYGRVLNIEGTSSDDRFENVEFVGINATSSSSYYAVVYSSSGTLNHRTVFENCGVRNGSYGMYLYGGSSSALEEDVVVRGCSFTGQYYRPLYSYYLGRLNFHENTVDFQSTYSGAYFAYTYNNADLSVERNVFFSDGGGTRYGVYFGSTDGTDNRFVNNFVTIINNGSSTARGLYLSSPSNVLVAFNSIFVNSTSTAGRCIYQTGGANQRLLNNILHNDGTGYAIYASSPSAIVESDYNLFYSNGSDLAYWSGTRTTLNDLQAASGMDANSISKLVTFRNPSIGDLHLAGASEDDTDLFGTLLKSVTEDIDNDLRVQPYRGADEACYITPGTVTYEFVDGSGMPAAFAEAPGTIGVRYAVAFPDFAATIEMTVRFYDPVTNQLAYETTLTAQKAANTALNGLQYITLPSTLPPGAYRVEVNFWTKNSCGVYRDYMPYPSSLLVVDEGRTPCVVWPGDANNDGVVNYADRRALNRYIFDANLRTSWLNGPARYQADVETNPFTYLEWKPQAAAPWQTPDGCYMDTDGNGTVNNLDYIAMKLNWSATTPWFGGAPRGHQAGATTGFSMDQNYPNPFNPSTTIRYHAAEASQVRLAVTDALGREVAVLENGRVDAGLHEVQFDASQFSSGTYVATITMTGIESGVTFLKTIKMALSK